jgi:hypothetical protein
MNCVRLKLLRGKPTVRWLLLAAAIQVIAKTGIVGVFQLLAGENVLEALLLGIATYVLWPVELVVLAPAVLLWPRAVRRWPSIEGSPSGIVGSGLTLLLIFWVLGLIALTIWYSAPSAKSGCGLPTVLFGFHLVLGSPGVVLGFILPRMLMSVLRPGFFLSEAN